MVVKEISWTLKRVVSWFNHVVPKSGLHQKAWLFEEDFGCWTELVIVEEGCWLSKRLVGC